MARAFRRSSYAPVQQGDRRRLSAGLHLQAGGRGGGADGWGFNAETSFTCPGYLTLGNATFHCWRRGGHGTLRLGDAIKKSCDVFFYETARRLGIDRLAVMARRFGFGSPLGIDIPGERSGLVPSREWKLANTGMAWLREKL